VYNPEADADTDLLGQLLFYVASGLYFALGGVEVLFGAVLGTFESVPLGGFAFGAVPLEMFVGVLTSGFELALRVALPVVGVVLLIAIVLGAVGKTMPQINVMSIGFTIKMLAGLLVLAAAMYSVGDAVEEEVRRTLDSVTGWTASLASNERGTHEETSPIGAPAQGGV
jgi:flagellar biosynthetic protein FliR